MKQENKISFWKKIKISIFGLEEYQKLAVQKVGSSIGYLAKLMLIFVFLISLVITWNFGKVVNQVSSYIENEIAEIHFAEDTLIVKSKDENAEAIVVEDTELLNGKIIIDTGELNEEQVTKYEEAVKGYSNGVIILKDKMIFKTGITAMSTTIPYQEIAQRYHIVKLDKQDITEALSGTMIWTVYIAFFITMAIYLFIIYFSTVLVDALLYSVLGYITGIFSRLRLKYSATYNIAVHALTLPIILNLGYMIVNQITGYTIQYFDIMYMAITCIYIITSILMIKSDMIKQQMELSKIISEQEKIKQELARQEQEKKEEEERERVRKEDEKKRQEEKKEKEEKRKTRDEKHPQPEANIREG
ncbi:MAG: DUF1189 domain-containing protein [Clostridia bacterium]|nr:DUF1189 domain-containing protein [Clostridia bacterium]